MPFYLAICYVLDSSLLHVHTLAHYLFFPSCCDSLALGEHGGVVYAWGFGFGGQLGTGEATGMLGRKREDSQSIPTMVAGLVSLWQSKHDPERRGIIRNSCKVICFSRLLPHYLSTLVTQFGSTPLFATAGKSHSVALCRNRVKVGGKSKEQYEALERAYSREVVKLEEKEAKRKVRLEQSKRIKRKQKSELATHAGKGPRPEEDAW